MGLERDKKYSKFKELFEEKLLKTYPTLGKSAEELFEFVAGLDPTSSAKSEKQRYLYLEWICSRILKDPPTSQNLYKVRQDLTLYISLSRLDKARANREGTVFYKPFVDAQISQYATLSSLSNAVFPYLELKERKKSEETQQAERLKAEENSTVLYNGPEGRIVVPLTMEASQYWGRGTKWCLSADKSDNLFERYTEDGKFPVLMFLPKRTSEKYAFNEYDEASGRNARDEEFNEADRQTLSDFINRAALTTDFEWSKVSDNKNLLRSVQLFFFLNPSIYSKMLASASEQPHALPEFLNINSMLTFSAAHLYPTPVKLSQDWMTVMAHGPEGDEDEESDDDLQRKQEVGAFVAGLGMIEQYLLNGDFATYDKMARLIPKNGLDEKQLLKLIGEIITLPEGLETADEFLEDYQRKMAIFEKLAERFPKIRSLQEEEDDAYEILYLKSIPKSIWTEKAFALSVIEKTNMTVPKLIEYIPEIFCHPEAWIDMLGCFEIEPDSTVVENAKNPIFHHIPSQRINGVPFMEIVANLDHEIYGKAISDLYSALCIYEAFGEAEGVDWSPVIKRLEITYPEGFETATDVALATNTLTDWDLSTLLERTISRHPEFFEDVAPHHQNITIVKAALRHDPEALADVAARFFAGVTKPPELAIAFQQMVERKSPYLDMVAHHFGSATPS